MTQCENILAHMKAHGSITPLTAAEIEELMVLEAKATRGKWRVNRHASMMVEAESGRGIGSTGGPGSTERDEEPEAWQQEKAGQAPVVNTEGEAK